MITTSLVFVYGTLRQGGSNNFRMNRSRRIGSATVHGHLYKVSWYPCLVLDENAGNVIGDLYEVSESGLAVLDDFEGSEYQRVWTTIHHTTGEARSAWLWEWRKPTEGLQAISCGDWLMFNHSITADDTPSG
ncbi:MAG: gamma-glutamylcyclotransferase family protein [Luteolibacter sp.]